MNEVTAFRIVNGYQVWIKFQDGVEKIVDFEPFLGKGFTAELLQPEKFKQLYIEDGGGLAWPNGYDFCPNYLHDYVADVQLAQA
ncbi:DUF2442 domain-containing protein [Spirosoma montaniterrae]|uniref:DUF2442 domain-containing protein n=1 Tax=Spirosoma montaniterrae TaxID=1178516 RepID=A0A1P9WZX5_9BACT|nr:DUF2442 domain-containing protein [Spirosoma montaniterrae]AQG80903.1 hypothetical protein AWR27_17195 [Spirosoma montaniterrae]